LRKRLLAGPSPSKVQAIPSGAPPWRAWPIHWLEWRTRVVTRTSSRATSPGLLPRRNAGSSGSWSRLESTWSITYTDLKPYWKSPHHLFCK
jgi:hypothetical protein